MPSRYNLYIGGEWKTASTGKNYPIYNPATEEKIATVAQGNEKDVDRAVRAAQKAFENDWCRTTPAERAGFLWKCADLLEKEALRFAKLESSNMGKTIRYARDSDLPLCIDNLRFFAGAARLLEGKSMGEYANYIDRGRRPLGSSMIRREPIGVVGAIVPWNYPLLIALWKIAPALAAGNTVVIKPSSLTPLTLLEFAKLTQKAGLPKGVLNVITGPGETVGKALATHPGIRLITFTGNVKTGQEILIGAASQPKRVQLELGGKAPLIALPDADLEAVARGAVAGAFWNSGQDCTAVTRVYVPASSYNKLIKLLLREIKKIRVGDPSKESTDMGPLISSEHRKRVQTYIEEGKKIARCLYGGSAPRKKGFFLQPTLFTDVPHESKMCQEEIFGPVLCVFKYKTVEEAIQKANSTKYGLAASVWGKEMTQLIKVSNALEFGTVWINEHGVLLSEMPHGGFKHSGFGKDLSLYGLDEFTQIKHIYLDQTGMARKPWHPTIYGNA